MKKLFISILSISLFYSQGSETNNQTNKEIQKAVDYYNVSLFNESKNVLIDLLYSEKGSQLEPEIRYHLGIISFYEGNISNAQIQWTKLLNKYPKDLRSKEINRILSKINRSEKSDELFKEENFEYSQDLSQAFIFWTPIIPNNKLFWGDLKNPTEANKYYRRLIKKYDDPKKKFMFTYYLFRLQAGFNRDSYGYNNKFNNELKHKAFKNECSLLLIQLEEFTSDETDINYNLLVQANYLWAIKLSDSKLFSGKVKVNEESKPYFNKVIELTEKFPNDMYRTFSKHWLDK